ncbi:similar to Saccharomyces cerevisiae YGR274C TAF1 TFIID subunit (145 kDa), involved in RNA polymerase II transcription initiation [Maudiozyma saulgeensis]|uniref:Similar to Saccharomyces cerevisiae YGR274C TAF1 TFIID subunit (145 kDa), involved in RNA polymerase II transcription initiation n=1 Tax=Maudiozyma saulgeensis TaxID=1789683 RepID=A0A1X7R422_9SACH|nr:similar to Saccharomyces cerevisiae YGR274C TAF1 TFIID subunit (145 kDa), involved in RNA polymerase II transcription initiation [Kazachstania saulgeensis]
MSGSKGLTPSNGSASDKKKKDDLTNEDDAYNAIFGGDLGSLEIGNYIGAGGDEGDTHHLPDAIDFEDEDELAEDELPEEEYAQDSVETKNHIVLPKRTTSSGELDADLMNTTFGGIIPTNNDFSDTLQQNTEQIMDDGLPNEEFHAGNNALFMEMDHSNLLFSDQQTSFSEFSKDITEEHREQRVEDFGNQSALVGVSNNELEEKQREEEQRQLTLMKNREKIKRDKLLLKHYFPDFKPNKIVKWNRAIYRKKHEYLWHYNKIDAGDLGELFPTDIKLHVQTDQKRLFKLDTSTNENYLVNPHLRNKVDRGIVKVSINELYPAEIKKQNKDENQHQEISEDILIATDDWDEEGMINGYSSDGNSLYSNDHRSSKKEALINKLQNKSNEWEWNEEDLIDAKLKSSKAAELDMNDEQLLLLLENKQNVELKKIQDVVHSSSTINEKIILQKFKISNDDEYNVLRRAHQPRIRATISNLNIEHSQPAINLQSPFYKVNPPRTSLRYYHRPRFGQHLRPGMVITFSKLKTRKRKRDKGKDIKESFATTQDLTIGDTAPVYLMEYSEQTPLALSQFGMSNKLINYYRKINDGDMMRPKLPVGETHVLGVQDKSPFWNFGFVEPGQIVPTLYNNMIRAPIFKHEVSGTDFLLVRSTGNGISNRFFLRNINHLFAVGQTFPIEEIPGPNSRKVTSMKATRLKMIVYRILNNTPSKAISIEPINKHFPDQDYGQNRQKVKEFMKYQRDGPDKGLWKLKEGEPLLDNESIKKLISPEQVCELESMSQGLQFWADNENFNFDDESLQLEENLLPWNSTKNFINATQMRAMVQVSGSGDPTGCGEGFSFLKASMKGGHSKNTNGKGPGRKGSSSVNGHGPGGMTQQRMYDHEISRTWYKHAKSLSVNNPFEEINAPDSSNTSNREMNVKRKDNKVLRITRKKRDQNGIIQRQTIVIKDPRVIKGYLRGKEIRKQANLDVNRLLEEDNPNIDNVEDIEMQKKLLQNELASLEKSQQRRVARQTSKKPVIGEDGKVVKTRIRRCATCGQPGHIKTNKSCPMYHLRNSTGRDTPASTAASTEAGTPVPTATATTPGSTAND